MEVERAAARVPHVYVGPKGRGGRWVPVESLPRIEAGNQRSIRHIENRLEYERAMLGEAGALSLLDKKPRPTLPPICNYRAPEGLSIENNYHRGEYSIYAQVEMTQAEYAAIYTDYKGTRVIEGSHRVRTAMVKHKHVCVFLTDSKVHEKPAAAVKVATVVAERPAPAPYVAPVRTDFDAMKDALRSGVAVQVVSAPQLFPTPADLARKMVDAAGIMGGERVLEPSAGTGNLVKAIQNAATGADNVRVVAVEISAALVRGLENARRLTIGANDATYDIRCADFLTCNGDLGKFDAVIMNPPFAPSAADITHIKHAVKFLRPGGRLVAICANGPRQREQLMPMVENSGGYWEDLPAGSFEASGTGVNTAMVVIEG